jgi:hypothetical protein
MEFLLACPNGQWVATKSGALAAVAKLGPLGFEFEKTERHGIEFVKVKGPVAIHIETLEALVELVTRMDEPLKIYPDRSLVLEDV